MKRKRSVSAERSKKDKLRAQKHRLANPFLEPSSAAASNQQSQNILSHVLLFLETTNPHTAETESADEVTRLRGALEKLLHYLAGKNDSGGDSSSLFKQQDVADVLLPWSTKNLFEKELNSVICWKTFEHCLETLLPPQEQQVDHRARDSFSTGALTTTLTQSRLNRLVLQIADVALGNTEISAVVPAAARCYCLLLERLYRPTIDVACHQALWFVFERVCDTRAGTSVGPKNALMLSNETLSVVAASVGLVRDLQKQGVSNAKKTFQLLCEPRVLLTLAYFYSWCTSKNCNYGINNDIRDVLWEAFFSPVHHMDGFRGINWTVPRLSAWNSAQPMETVQTSEKDNEKARYHCYQQLLLETLKDSILNDSESDTAATAQVIAWIRLTTLLMEGFIAKSIEWGQEYHGSTGQKGAKSQADISILQFRFWTNLIFPVLVRLHRRSDEEPGRGIAASCTSCLQDTLAMILENDSYLPSYKDKDSTHFSFLFELATQLFDLMDVVPSASQLDVIPSVEILIRLNHLTVHSRLEKVFQVCINQDTGQQEHSHQATLLLTAVSTYHSLRQLDHLCVSILKALDNFFSTSRLPKDTASKSSSPLFDPKVVQTLALSTHDCPHGQIRDIFSHFDLWISEKLGSAKDSSILTSAKVRNVASMISYGVSLYNTVIRNVRVDKHTSAVVSQLCNDTLAKCVLPGIEQPEAQSLGIEVRRQLLVLCAWLIDLKNRCAFWQEDADAANVSVSVWDAISTMLEPFIESEREHTDSISAEMVGELQFLACYRIQHLHSLNQDSLKREGAGDSLQQKDEIKKLVHFVVATADEMGSCVTFDAGVCLNGWRILVQMLPYWLPYSDSGHVKAFLAWLFSNLAVADAEIKSTSSTLRAYPHDRMVEKFTFEEERAVAMALLRDSSFFELSEIACQLHFVGLACATDLTRLALMPDLDEDTGDCPVTDKLKILIPVQEQGYSTLSASQFSRAVAASEESTVCSSSRISIEMLRRACRLMDVMNGIRKYRMRKSQTPILFDAAMRLILTLRLVHNKLNNHKAPDLVEASNELLCNVQFFASSLLVQDSIWDPMERSQLFGDAKGIRLGGILQLIKQTLIFSLREGIQSQLLVSTRQLLDSILILCLDVFDMDDLPLKHFVAGVEAFAANHRQNRVSSKVFVSISRTVLKRLSVVMGSQDICEKSCGAELLKMIDSIRRNLNESLEEDEWLSCKERLLLAGDVMRVRSFLGESDTDDPRCSVAIQKLLSTNDEMSMQIVSYYLACSVSKRQVSQDVADTVLQMCLSLSARTDPFMDSAFCALVCKMSPEQIRKFVQQLRLKFQSSRAVQKATLLHLFRSLLSNIETAEQTAELTAHAPDFFIMIVELLQPTNEEATIEAAVRCLLAIAQNKDIIRIRERDLVLIFTQINEVLGNGGPKSSQEFRTVPDGVYSSCFALVSSLIQRFPKQLYSSVPSVATTLQSLMRHALYGPISEVAMTSRSQQFSRLCELLVPHVDVYKKHILALLLEFVRTLGEDLHRVRKEGLLPGIFCLLDLLSQYEMNQLNSFMDATEKAMFRSIYQSYQKLHLYKGQY